MPSITFKNQRLDSFVGARDLTSLTQDLIFGRVGLPTTDISALNVEPSFLYSADELVINLESSDQTIAEPEEDPIDFVSRIGEAFLSAGLSEIGREQSATQPAQIIFTTPAKIRVNSFWNISSDVDVVNSSNYRVFETEVEILTSTENRISFRLLPSEEMEVSEVFNSLGVTKPNYGMLLIVLEFQIPDRSKFEQSYLVKYTHAPLFSSPIFREASPVNFSSNTYTSPGYSSETLFVPTLTSSFFYNFYELEESEYDVYKSRDYKGKKLSDIPKYVKLSWNKPSFDSVEFNRINNPPVVAPSFAALEPISPEIRRAIIPREEAAPASLFVSGRMVSLTDSRQQIAAALAGAPRLAAAANSAFTNPATINLNVLDSSIVPRVEIHDFLATRASDYIGYVIEKFRITEDGIDFELIDVIAIPQVSTLEYIDTKISYGEVYRYRIKSVFRFVNNFDLPMFGDSDASLNQKQTKNYIDQNQVVNLKKTYYYDSESSKPSVVSATESTRPDSPSAVRGFPNTKNKTIFLTWSQKNTNRDVSGFNVYRKEVSDKNYTKLNSELLNIRENFYIDSDLKVDTDYVYSVESVDIHGNFSKLSVQLILKIKQVINFDQIITEEKQKIYKTEGFELNEASPEILSQLMIIKSSLKMNVNPLFRTADGDSVFVVKVTSLDTGQVKQFMLNFTSQTIYHITPPEPNPPRNWIVQLAGIEALDSTRRAILGR
jgi:hypothetical protein